MCWFTRLHRSVLEKLKHFLVYKRPREVDTRLTQRRTLSPLRALMKREHSLIEPKKKDKSTLVGKKGWWEEKRCQDGDLKNLEHPPLLSSVPFYLCRQRLAPCLNTTFCAVVMFHHITFLRALRSWKNANKSSCEWYPGVTHPTQLLC